jgi:Mn-dependent DtxR family transcriptional regulator
MLKDIYMPYERTKKIEERFETAVSLIRGKRLSAGQLADELSVSLPTAQRIVGELKRRGYPIRSVHEEHGWHYEISGKRRGPEINSPNKV